MLHADDKPVKCQSQASFLARASITGNCVEIAGRTGQKLYDVIFQSFDQSTAAKLVSGHVTRGSE